MQRLLIVLVQYVAMEKAKKEQDSMVFIDKKAGVWQGYARKSGNSARVILPVAWVDKMVRVQLVDGETAPAVGLENVMPYVEDRLTKMEHDHKENIEELFINFNDKLERTVAQLTKMIDQDRDNIMQHIDNQREDLMQMVVDKMGNTNHYVTPGPTPPEPSDVVLDELKKTQEKLEEYNDIKERIDRLSSIKKRPPY